MQALIYIIVYCIHKLSSHWPQLILKSARPSTHNDFQEQRQTVFCTTVCLLLFYQLLGIIADFPHPL